MVAAAVEVVLKEDTRVVHRHQLGAALKNHLHHLEVAAAADTDRLPYLLHNVALANKALLDPLVPLETKDNLEKMAVMVRTAVMAKMALWVKRQDTDQHLHLAKSVPLVHQAPLALLVPKVHLDPKAHPVLLHPTANEANVVKSVRKVHLDVLATLVPRVLSAMLAPSIQSWDPLDPLENQVKLVQRAQSDHPDKTANPAMLALVEERERTEMPVHLESREPQAGLVEKVPRAPLAAAITAQLLAQLQVIRHCSSSLIDNIRHFEITLPIYL
jgi:hypothetical protein